MKTVKSWKQRGKVTYTFLALPVGDGLNEDGTENKIGYNVRGLSPIENELHGDIMGSVTMPIPPTKKRVARPLDGKIEASQLGMEEYRDIEDPSYLDALKTYEEELKVMWQQASMYRIMVCVQGFDVSDEDIKAELEEEAIPKDSLDNLLKRIDQVCRIVLPEFDQRHFMALLAKISNLTGVKTETVNFT